jgi:MoxR-like ATPase
VPTATKTQTVTLLDKYGSIFGPDGFLEANNVERKEAIELLGLAFVSGVDTLFLGDPGVGKTWLIELLVDHCITNAQLFNHLLAKDMSADEVLGPRDIMAMKAGKIARLTAGYAPSANFAYLDEVFKASPPLLNPLLDLLANRVVKVGGQVMDCSQLITILMSSNELPDREDLLAFRDRIGVTYNVQPVRTPDGRRAVTDIQLDFQANGLDTSTVQPLTLDEVQAIRAEVKLVKVNDVIRQVMVDAQQKWTEAGHPPSQRRIGQMWKIVKARAWANGRSEVVTDDFLPCQHMAWNHPDDAASAREIILEFASVYTRKAQRLREAMEPVQADMEALRTKLEAATDESEKDDLMSDGFKFMRQLRKLRVDTRTQIKDGEKQGQDTTLLNEVHSDINRLYEWAEKALAGEEEAE